MASDGVSKQLIKCQAMGVVWRFLDAFEVTQWQALSLWMYKVAVSRAQTRVHREKRVYFLRREPSYLIDELWVTSSRLCARQ